MLDGEAVDSRLTWDKVRAGYRGLGEAAAPAIMVTVPATMVITEVVELFMVLSQGLYNRFKRETGKDAQGGFRQGSGEGPRGRPAGGPSRGSDCHPDLESTASRGGGERRDLRRASSDV